MPKGVNDRVRLFRTCALVIGTAERLKDALAREEWEKAQELVQGLVEKVEPVLLESSQ